MATGRRIAYILVAAAVVGVGLRLAAPLTMDVAADGAYYSVMGRSLAEDATLTMPNGTIYFPEGDAPAASHHYPPLYPALLAAAYSVAGYGAAATKWVAALTGVALVLVAWLTTRDLYGSKAGLFAAALTAPMPFLVLLGGIGYSENLVALLYTLTIWSILKSLQKPPYIALGGLFAGLAYLSKSSVGALFLVAGLAGFLWRLKFMGGRVFRDRWYLLGGAIFASIVGAWALRNVIVHGAWETSRYVGVVNAHAITDPLALLASIWGKTLLFVVFGGALLLPFLPELRREAAKRDEATLGLLLAVALPFVFGIYFSAAFYLYEPAPFVWHDNARYLLLAYVPALWLVREAADTRRAAAVACVFVLLAAAIVAAGVRYPEAAAAQQVDEGDLVAVKDLPVYYVYPYILERGATPTVWRDGLVADHVIALDPTPPAGYVLVQELHANALGAGASTAYLFAPSPAPT